MLRFDVKYLNELHTEGVLYFLVFIQTEVDHPYILSMFLLNPLQQVIKETQTPHPRSSAQKSTAQQALL